MRKLALVFIVGATLVACNSQTTTTDASVDSTLTDSLVQVDTAVIEEVDSAVIEMEEKTEELKTETEKTSEEVDDLLKGI
jgi:uncharacterized protein YcfL